MESQKGAGIMLIELPIIWIVVINIVLWGAIHMGIAYFATILPEKMIKTDSKWFEEKDWERGGKIYEDVFKIKKWKEILPDGSALFKQGFRKKRMQRMDKDYLKRFVLEVCRAEMAHWIVILFSPIFFIWNWWWAGIIMIVYAFIANMPCILAQRYNRIRLRRLLRAKS